ncbi:hypothetical protein ACEWY4_011034 [Coilia grayii]|uniref:Troponin I, fast skeletal muscle n=1 Tax=Coilia grayii TaxID=363190 RepID=A0ABD1K3L4_9TELE
MCPPRPSLRNKEQDTGPVFPMIIRARTKKDGHYLAIGKCNINHRIIQPSCGYSFPSTPESTDLSSSSRIGCDQYPAKMSEKKMSSSRKYHLKSLMLSIAKGLLETEIKDREEEKSRYLSENCPTLSLPSGTQALQEFCRELHHKIDRIDEERYDLEVKSNKGSNDIEDLKIKVQDLKGKFKKPVLRKVRMSADQMLQALLGSKHKVNLDLRANLKQVKKEVKEEEKELRDVGDWRKNIEDKSGMDGRKKMFEGGEA